MREKCISTDKKNRIRWLLFINNFIKINLTISLDINELSTLNYILSILNLGKISIFPKEGKKKLVS